MKNRPFSFLFSLFIPLIPLASAHADDVAYIQTRNATILSEPKLLSKVKKKLSYGDAVSVLNSEAGWIKVRSSDKVEGFIHNSALSSRSVSLSGSKSGDGGVSNSDISLAGKGFSPEIEKQLAAQNGGLNFAAVDAMEKITVSPDQTRAFVKSGKLNESLF